MCGIIGYVGSKEAYPIIIKGLKRLEYRGYDSAGVSITKGKDLNIFKQAGKVSDLENAIDVSEASGTIGIGHTRWATHGAPNQVNSHPHSSGDEQLSLIHNGILKIMMLSRNHLLIKGILLKVKRIQKF